MNIIKNEPMEKHTTFKIGGPADEFFEAETMEDIFSALEYVNNRNLSIFVMGNGSNLLVSDKGIRGFVLKIADKFSKYEISGEIIKAESGALLSTLSKSAQRSGLSGMEFASGIPGTLGGAILMNAGAYGGEMKDIVKSVTYIENGELKKEEKDFGFGYRKSIFQDKNAIIVEAEIKLKKGNPDEIKAEMEEFKKRRVEKQPLSIPSAGSTFKRPEGYFAGKLIQDAGLVGYSVGGAMVSEKHAGFVVNKGGATAQDVMSLILHIQKTVMEKFGVSLETEVKMVGEF